MYISYFAKTNDVDADSSPVWPARFHALIAYEMAVIFNGGIDPDEISSSKFSGMLLLRKELRDSFEQWDARIKSKSMNDSTQQLRNFDNQQVIKGGFIKN